MTNEWLQSAAVLKIQPKLGLDSCQLEDAYLGQYQIKFLFFFEATGCIFQGLLNISAF